MAVPVRAKSCSPVKILLVDDNNCGLTARAMILQEQGYCVTTATHAEEALARLSQTRFDLLITDYCMPGMNGVELIYRVRTSIPELPVILLSGYVEAIGLTESNTGADIVLAKSANEVTQLVRSVERLLRRRTVRKPPARIQAANKRRQAGS
jgi:CheY-like chemotaxis protein